MLTDVRYAARVLAKAPLFSALAIITLALGIGANTAIFSVVNTLLLQPLPYSNPGRLVTIWEVNPLGKDNVSGSPANYLYRRDAARTTEAMAAVSNTFRTTLSGQGEPEELPMQYVTANVFPLLGVAPELGRTFTSDEDQPKRNQVVVLSDRLWRRRFGADPSIVGRTVHFDGDPHVVVGIMPPGFSIRDKTVDLWKPVGFTAAQRQPSGRWIQVLARLKPGVTIAQAQQDMNRLQADLIRMFPAFDTGWRVHVRSLRDDLTGAVRPALFVLLSAVGFVLLIACANVSNLLLARAISRQREIALRAALGADRRRLAQQVFVESAVLSAAGGALGLMLAWLSIVALRTTVAAHLPVPRLEAVHVDGWVLAFAAIVSMLSAIVFGIAPALSAAGTGLVDRLKEGGRTGTAGRSVQTRNIFVLVETALALVLLVGAGLLVRSFVALIDVDAGFDPSHTISMKITLPTAKYSDTSFFDRLYSQIDAMPGVVASGGVSFLPLNGLGSATDFSIVGRPKPDPGTEPVADVRVATHDYFKAMRIPLIAGRLFDSRDTGDQRHHVIVSEALVRRFFPNEDPIGKHIVIDWNDSVPDEIVGVVGDVHLTTLDAEPRATTYWPPSRFAYPWNSVVIRTSGDPTRIVPQVAAIVRRYDPTIALADVRTLGEVMSISVAEQRLTMILLASFAGLALLLAAIGIYGVVSYAVSERTHEIGIRMALGAERTAVMRMVVAQGLAPTLAGILVGGAGAWLLTRLMTALLFGVTASDPATFGMVAALLVLVALAAAAIPGLRATRVDPVVALRSE